MSVHTCIRQKFRLQNLLNRQATLYMYTFKTIVRQHVLNFGFFFIAFKNKQKYLLKADIYCTVIWTECLTDIKYIRFRL